MQKKPVICLTFDLEEFDLPLEYKQEINPQKQFEITNRGLNNLLPVLEKHNASCTFFTTANYAQNNISIVKDLASKHEIASHSFHHSSFDPGDLIKSKQALEQITSKEIYGFRMPRMGAVNYKELSTAGYRYDSSLHPTWLPGRYNHFSSPKTIFKKEGVLVFPASVTPFFRTPLFWLSFKNFSSARYISLVQKCLSTYGYVNIYLHPWEFADLTEYRLPGYIAKSPALMKQKLEALLNHFSGKAEYNSVISFLRSGNEL